MTSMTTQEKVCRKLHIIITGEEGLVHSFVLHKGWLRGTLAVICVLVLLSIAGIDFFCLNSSLMDSLHRTRDTLAKTTSTNRQLHEQVSRLTNEKEELLANAVSDLNNKSRLIESILGTVGVEVTTVQESTKDSGGPFTEDSIGVSGGDLLAKVDNYLDAMRTVPLGAPVHGVISSQFGRRVDPINSRKAFHEGVDIRGDYGTEIKATAEGTVEKQGYDNIMGRFVLIDHGNGFKTRFGHMQKNLTKVGSHVSRGDAIGLIGTTGRSTGPHVHYEITYQDNPVDPDKFMRISNYIDLYQPSTASR